MKPYSTSIILAFSILAIALLVTACGPSSTSSDSIHGILWQWTSVTNQTTKEATPVPNPENYTITFNEDGTLEGKADCNTISGTYSQENGFSITLGATSMMYCGDA
jgi:heat shock protein HslJ